MSNIYLVVNSDNTIAGYSSSQYSDEMVASFAEMNITIKEVDSTVLDSKLEAGHVVESLAMDGVRYIEGEFPDGFELRFTNDDLVSVSDYIDENYTLAQSMFNAARRQIVDAHDEFDAATFTAKAERAQRIIDGTASDLDIELFQSEVDERSINGETVESLAQRSIEKWSAYESKIYRIAGLQKRMNESLLNAGTKTRVDEIAEEIDFMLQQLINED